MGGKKNPNAGKITAEPLSGLRISRLAVRGVRGREASGWWLAVDP